MCDSHKCLIVTRFSKFSLGMYHVCVVNLFRSILPVVGLPTECDLLIVGNIMTIIVHFTIEHQVYYDSKFREQHAKIWENIARAKRYSRPPLFQHCGGERPRRPLHSNAYDNSIRPTEKIFSNIQPWTHDPKTKIKFRKKFNTQESISSNPLNILKTSIKYSRIRLVFDVSIVNKKSELMLMRRATASV